MALADLPAASPRIIGAQRRKNVGGRGGRSPAVGTAVKAALAVPVVFLGMSAAPATAAVHADVKAWAFAGGTSFRIPLSELNFPAGGTMPILTVAASRLSLRYGGSAVQQATWTDSDWTSPQLLTGPRPQPDASQTQGRMAGDFSLYAVNVALAPDGTTQFVFLGYGGSSYDFTMPSPVLCTIGPGCTPGVYYATLNDPLTSAFSYSGPWRGLHTGTQMGGFAVTGSLAVGLVSASGYVGWGSGTDRRSPTPVSGNGSAISGEVGVEYAAEAVQISLGYQVVTFDVSGTAQFSPAGPVPWRQWGSGQGATLAAIWSW